MGQHTARNNERGVQPYKHSAKQCNSAHYAQKNIARRRHKSTTTDRGCQQGDAKSLPLMAAGAAAAQAAAHATSHQEQRRVQCWWHRPPAIQCYGQTSAADRRALPPAAHHRRHANIVVMQQLLLQQETHAAADSRPQRSRHCGVLPANKEMKQTSARPAAAASCCTRARLPRTAQGSKSAAGRPSEQYPCASTTGLHGLCDRSWCIVR